MSYINKTVGYKKPSHKGDVNILAKQRQSSRIGPILDDEARKNFDEINWKSRR